MGGCSRKDRVATTASERCGTPCMVVTKNINVNKTKSILLRYHYFFFFNCLSLSCVSLYVFNVSLIIRSRNECDNVLCLILCLLINALLISTSGCYASQWLFYALMFAFFFNNC